MRASLPMDRVGVHSSPITDVATSVDSSVRIQDLLVPTLTRCSDSVGVSGNRCGVHREEQSGTGPPLRFASRCVTPLSYRACSLSTKLRFSVHRRRGRFSQVQRFFWRELHDARRRLLYHSLNGENGTHLRDFLNCRGMTIFIS